MSNRTNLDRAYFSLIDSCNEAVKLATVIACNANYKEAIQTATDPLIIDCCKEAMRLRRTLQEVLNRQEYANVKSMPEGR